MHRSAPAAPQHMYHELGLFGRDAAACLHAHPFNIFQTSVCLEGAQAGTAHRECERHAAAHRRRLRTTTSALLQRAWLLLVASCTAAGDAARPKALLSRGMQLDEEWRRAVGRCARSPRRLDERMRPPSTQPSLATRSACVILTIIRSLRKTAGAVLLERLQSALPSPAASRGPARRLLVNVRPCSLIINISLSRASKRARLR